MKKSLTLILMGCILLFTGCANVVNTEKKEVTATIVKTKYKSSYTTTTYMGKTMVPIYQNHPEEYNVILDYKGIKYYLNNKEAFNICNNNDNKEVICELEVQHFDDGTDKNSILAVVNISD